MLFRRAELVEAVAGVRSVVTSVGERWRGAGRWPVHTLYEQLSLRFHFGSVSLWTARSVRAQSDRVSRAVTLCYSAASRQDGVSRTFTIHCPTARPIHSVLVNQSNINVYSALRVYPTPGRLAMMHRLPHACGAWLCTTTAPGAPHTPKSRHTTGGASTDLTRSTRRFDRTASFSVVSLLSWPPLSLSSASAPSRLATRARARGCLRQNSRRRARRASRARAPGLVGRTAASVARPSASTG